MIRDPETNETLLKGMGQVPHRGRDREAEAEVRGGRAPRIAASGVSRDDHGQGEVAGKVLATERGPRAVGRLPHRAGAVAPPEPGCRSEDGIVGGVIPRNFIPSVEHGIRDAAKQGPLGGSRWWISARGSSTASSTPWTARHGVRIAGDGAEEHPRLGAKPVLLGADDAAGSGGAGRDAGRGDRQPDFAARKNLRDGADFQGDADPRRGAAGGARTYAPELRSLTKGLGYFTMDILGYEEVPTHEAQKVLAQRAAEQGKDEPKPTQPGKGRA